MLNREAEVKSAVCSQHSVKFMIPRSVSADFADVRPWSNRSSFLAYCLFSSGSCLELETQQHSLSFSLLLSHQENAVFTSNIPFMCLSHTASIKSKWIQVEREIASSIPNEWPKTERNRNSWRKLWFSSHVYFLSMSPYFCPYGGILVSTFAETSS